MSGLEADRNEPLTSDDEDRPVRRMIRRVRRATRPDTTINFARETPHLATEIKLDAAAPASTSGKPSTEDDSVDSSLNNSTPTDELADTEVLEYCGKPPTAIGRFQVQRTLGRGGFGVVLLAHDPQLDRPVALKLPKLEALASDVGRARFIREARAAALLGHPNIVSIFEAGHIGAVMYIAFEYIDGQPLDAWMKSNAHEAQRFDAQLIAKLMSALAAGVQHAHQRGIIHRDLKPANVLIQQESSARDERNSGLANRAKIADFGLACSNAVDGITTQSGAIMGTPMYVAPEQLSVSSNSSTPAVDVYGLGAILYELLTNRPPFDGTTLAAIACAVETQLPVAPRRIRPETAPDLEAICLKCLEKRPARRYGSAAELQDDLERFLDGRPVRARHWTRRERAWRWLVRNRTMAALVSVIFAVLLSGIVVAGWQANRNRQLFVASERHRLDATRNAEKSTRERQRAEVHRDLAESIIDQMLNQVADALEPIPHMEAFRRHLLETALEHEHKMVATEQEHTGSQLRVARTLLRIGKIQQQLGQFVQARSSFETSLARLSELDNVEDEELLKYRLLHARSVLGVVSMLEMEQAWSEAYNRLKELIPEIKSWLQRDDHPDLHRVQFEALLQFARTHESRQQFDLAKLLLTEAQAELMAIPENQRTSDDRWDLLTIHNQLGKICYFTGDLAQAIEKWQYVLDEQRVIGESNNWSVLQRLNRAKMHHNLASALISTGDLTQAMMHYQDADIQLQRLCSSFPFYPEPAQTRINVLNGLCHALIMNRQIDEAIENSLIAIEWSENVLDSFGEQPEILAATARLTGNLGKLYFEEKQNYGLAEQAWIKQNEICRRLVAIAPETVDYKRQLSIALGNRASLLIHQQRLDEARLILDQSYELAASVLQALQGHIAAFENFRDQLAKSAFLRCLQGDHKACLELLSQLQNLKDGDPENQIFAASVAARCITNTEIADEDSIGQAREMYRQFVINTLKSVQERGVIKRTHLQQNVDFRSLEADPEFQAIVGSLNH
ncbi:MAG TPA: protein kinase [Pirellulaceae bacterium]|nr:protein kinase [Pirellulaceae bacterium]HMP70109.1 protein kinase [Pirellulaceae bacterium]